MNSFDVFAKGYTFLWRLARPFLQHHKRLHENFSQRLVPTNWAEPATIWIQSSSGGEAYLVRSLLEHLPIQDSTLHILLTTWTPQGRIILEETKSMLEFSRSDLSIQVQYVPLDEPALMEKALIQVSPQLVVLIEAEIWPGLLFACNKRNIPVLVLNGRVREKSLRGYDWFSWFFPEFWRAIAPKYVAAISSADAARFTALFGEYCVGVVPNIKFDRAICTLSQSDFSKNVLTEILPDKPIVLLASVREEEEALLVPVIKKLYSRHGKDICIIVAPRHEFRVKEWVKKLNFVGITTQLRSTLTLYKEELYQIDIPVIVWDTFGELDKLYNLAQAVFVGGSLAPLGGQNFLEPLSVGKIPCVGKYLDNFSWVFEPLFDNVEHEDFSFFIRICHTPFELIEQLEHQLQHPEPKEEIISRFNTWLESRKGGADKCASLIMSMLEQ